MGPYFNDPVQGLLQGLAILAESSLQIYCVLSWPQSSLHKYWRELGTLRMLRVSISVHPIGINPKDVSQTL